MDHLEPLRILRQRLDEATNGLGLTVRQFMPVIAAEHGEPDHLQVVFTIDADAIGRNVEDSKVDKQFAELEAQFKRQAEDDKRNEAEASLRKLLDKHKKDES